MLPCPATSAVAAHTNASAVQSIARLASRGGVMASTFSRRTFLKVSAAGGALVISGYIPGLNDTAEAAGSFEPNVWLKIGADDTVTITLSQLEMGQGVMTSMQMLVAEELDIDWNKIKTEWAPADPKYGNPNFGGAQLTAGSNSVRGMWRPLREAGGTARAMLVTAAAKDWSVAENTCSTEKGEVIHKATGRRARYGSLVDKAAALPVPKDVSLKDPKDFRLLGKTMPRLDIPEKVNGKAVFGIDVKRPNMLIARVVRCPVFGGKVATFNADKAKEAADVRSDRCDVWVPTQGQTASAAAAVAASGLPAKAVNIHTTYLGGGFGRRGEADFATDAVETSKATGKPVKVIWTREDDIQHDYYRPVSYVRMWGALDPSGNPVAFMQRIVQQSLMKRLGPLPPNGVGFISVDGSGPLPYAIPNISVEYTETDPGIPYGFWRSVGASVQGFVVEGFIDELATTAGKDPYQFRHDLLSKHPRHRAVLDLVAEKSGWGKPLPAGHARGIAVMEAFGSIVGEVAEVSVTNGAVRVHKVWCAVDTGWVINPDTIKAQMEGGTIYGLTAALKGEITIQNGRVAQHHFNDYPMIRHNEAPEVEVHILPSTEKPGGIGEPSTAVAAGALANAIFAATGKRIYTLPIRAEQLRA